MSRVHAQPTTPAAAFRALQALVACPTSSIGALGDHDVRAAAASFPESIEAGETRILHCGYHHPDTFGAASYLILRAEGNVLVDSPRFARPLVRRIEELGGVALMFLTHRDDVGDHKRFAEHFGCERVMHARDMRRGIPSIERPLEGEEPIRLAHDLRVIPTPGHTAGSACLIFDDESLFSGDHVAWSPGAQRIHAFRDACWFDWNVQIESMRRLALERFSRILPGHGRRCRFEPDAMRREMEVCVEWMESVR